MQVIAESTWLTHSLILLQRVAERQEEEKISIELLKEKLDIQPPT